MFYLNSNTELTMALLSKMINRFNLNVEPIRHKYKNYYDGEQAILNKSYADESKPCNKTVINYCKNIVDSYCGYLAAPGCISYRSSDTIKEVMEVLRYNDHQTQDSEFLLNGLIYGVGVELMYLDNESKVRFRTLNPTQCFGVYDDSLTGDLLYFVRIYKQDDWDESNTYCVDVYNDRVIKHYIMGGKNGDLTYTGIEPHNFSQCPANIFYLPDEKSIFDCIINLQDSVNELVSAEIDDYSAFCDAYLVLEGVDLDEEDVKGMKENRVLLLPPGAKAGWLTKNANDAQIENTLKRAHDSIYRIAQCPDFSSETFVGGVSSGVAIKYRLTGMETRAGIVAAELKKALLRRIEIICGVVSLKVGEDVFMNVEIDFKRNIPEDITSTINMINSLKGTVSDATLLGQLDFITDVNAELTAVEDQKQRNMSLYSFGSASNNEEEEEE